jgi:hypothetical protein
MAIPERDTVYTNDGTNRSVYLRISSTGWFVGIIVAWRCWPLVTWCFGIQPSTLC